jgi:SAM-dependent methyltransferase
MSDPVHVLTPAYYERLAALESRHWWWRGTRAVAERLLDGVAPASRTWRVLDAGCGTGLTLTWVRRFTDVEPAGLDRAVEGLRFCRARGHRRLLQGDAVAIPIRDGSVDLALSLDVIQHLPRPGGDQAAIDELARVLVPGGYLLLRTNSRCGYPPDAAADYHRYTLREIRTLISRAALAPVTVSYINLVPALALTLSRKLRRRGAPSSDPGLPAAPAVVDRSLRARTGERLLRLEGTYLRRVGWPLPYGHSIVALARKR